MQCWAEGTPEWRLQVAHAAQSGVMAAVLAEQGATAANEAFEGSKGFYNTFCGRVPEISLNGWDLDRVVFKPFPGCMINQGAVYLLHSMMRQHSFTMDDISSVRIRMAIRDATHPGIAQHGPFDQATGAVMSMPFMATMLLTTGGLKSTDFERLHDKCSSRVHELSRKIVVESASELQPWTNEVWVTLHTGREIFARIEDQSVFALGWVKALDLLHGVAAEWPFENNLDRLVCVADAVRALESAPDMARIVQLCTR